MKNPHHCQIQKTILYNQHLQLQANMVDFHNWMMPLHYGSQIQEHLAVRQNCGLFDVSHMGIVDINGPEAKNFLRYILANDVKQCQPNQAMYSCMLNTDGGIIDDLIVYKISTEQYKLIFNAGCFHTDIQWLRKNAHNFETNIIPNNKLALIALQGPNAASILGKLINCKQMGTLDSLRPFKFLIHKQWLVARTGYTGEDGFEIMLPQEQAETIWQNLLQHGARACGLAARDSLRLEAGFNLYGKDIADNLSPLCTNLHWTINWQDSTRNFLGKDALLQEKQQPINEKLIGVHLIDKGVLRDEQIIYACDKSTIPDTNNTLPCGIITSGSFSPSLKQAIGLARIQSQHLNQSFNYYVQVRNKWMQVIPTKPQFVRRGSAVVQPLFSENKFTQTIFDHKLAHIN